MGKSLAYAAVVIVLGAVLLIAWNMTLGHRGEVERALFGDDSSLESALDRADESGRPVFVLVEALWCPNCAVLKKNGLANKDSIQAIVENTEAARLDLTQRELQFDDTAMLDRLDVSVVPTMVLLDSGREVSRLVGVQDSETIVRWIESRGKADVSESDKQTSVR